MEEGISKILELGISQGIWAALYIYFFFRLSGNIEGGIEKIQNKLDSMSNGD